MGARIRLNKEHVTIGASSVGGEHKQGSAVCYHQASAPTTRPDGTTALTSADIGRVWLDSTNNVLKELSAIGAPNTWTPIAEIALALYTIGTEPTRGLYMKGNELYFKGSDATEKFIAGLLDEDDMASDSATRAPSQQSVVSFVTSGAISMANKTLASPIINTPTIASPVLNTGVSGSAVKDEDDMASNSATALATQQSIKAYFDAARCVVQIQSTAKGTFQTCSTVIPCDDTIPQITEGDEILTCAITPKFATSKLRVDVTVLGSPYTSLCPVAALFETSTHATNALAVGSMGLSNTTNLGTIQFTHIMDSPGTSAITLRVRAGTGASPFYLNGTGTGALYGGKLASSITVTEYLIP